MSPPPVVALEGSRRRGPATAERILAAGEALFAERGYHGTTLRDVADRVGLRIPSLYNHFPSKDALYAAVLERGIGPVVELLSKLALGPPAERDDPLRVVEPVMRMLAERPHLPRLVLHETLAGGEHLTPMLREWLAPAFARAPEHGEGRGAAPAAAPGHAELRVRGMYHTRVGLLASAPRDSAQ
jgi:AcrR family transcriptional regulator